MAKPITHTEFTEKHPTLKGRFVEATNPANGKTFLSCSKGGDPTDDEVKSVIDKNLLVTFSGDIYTVYGAYDGDRKPDGDKRTRNSITMNCDKRPVVF